MKKTKLFFIIVLAILNLYILPNFICVNNITALAQTYISNDNFIVRAYGDSISAGYGLDGYNDYINKTTLITKESYPNVFMQDYIQTFGGEIKSFAVTGHQSNKLASKLSQYINKTAQDYEDFCKTNIFTLCIGANNILSVASANFEKLLKGEMKIEEYKLLLEQKVDLFESDYVNTILPALTQNADAKIFVMTIYNPYKYITFNDIKVDTQNAQNNFLVKSVLSALDQTFQEVLSTTITYLEKINDIIRQNANNSVIVVDIYKLFETFTKEQYKTYINADLSKMTITKELYESIDWQNMDFSNLFSTLTVCSDPHPTELGQQVIANCHKENFAVFKLNMETDLSKIENDEQEVFFLIKKVGGQTNYNFKLYKNINNNVTLLKETNEYSFSVKAKDIDGDGYFYLEIYENNKKIGQSNIIEYSYKLQNEKEIDQNQTPKQPLPQNNNINNIVIGSIIFVGIVAFCIVGYIIFKSYKKNNIK